MAESIANISYSNTLNQKIEVCLVFLIIISSEPLREFLSHIPESLGFAGSEVWNPSTSSEN